MWTTHVTVTTMFIVCTSEKLSGTVSGLAPGKDTFRKNPDSAKYLITFAVTRVFALFLILYVHL